MKRTKKNNKGFSLVELIVVVLIMAIIAVALAPQIMKWVDKSRNSSDAAVYDNVVSACQSTLTDEEIWAGCSKDGDTITITMDKEGLKFVFAGVDAGVQEKFVKGVADVLGTKVDDTKTAISGVKMKATYDETKKEVPTITINKGIVERTKEPAAKVEGKASTTNNGN